MRLAATRPSPTRAARAAVGGDVQTVWQIGVRTEWPVPHQGRRDRSVKVGLPRQRGHDVPRCGAGGVHVGYGPAGGWANPGESAAVTDDGQPQFHQIVLGVRLLPRSPPDTPGKGRVARRRAGAMQHRQQLVGVDSHLVSRGHSGSLCLSCVSADRRLAPPSARPAPRLGVRCKGSRWVPTLRRRRTARGPRRRSGVSAHPTDAARCRPSHRAATLSARRPAAEIAGPRCGQQ